MKYFKDIELYKWYLWQIGDETPFFVFHIKPGVRYFYYFDYDSQFVHPWNLRSHHPRIDEVGIEELPHFKMSSLTKRALIR